MWARYAKHYHQLHFHARWYKQVENSAQETPENAAKFWVEDDEDVTSADAVLVYGEGDDHLRGALVEAGMALARKIPVLIVGDYEYGTWIYHPDVLRFETLDDAIWHLLNMELRRCDAA
jgi:nucleoside 2-deoxyribosyltransferase